MVYRGKPSQACEACRRKRIRCDKREPNCGNCERARQTCPGYRNKLDLMFFDETANTTQRHGVANQSGQGSGANRELQAIELAPRIRADFTRPSMDDFALSYCNAHHIIWLESTSNTEIQAKDGKLLNCMRALGMASYATTVQSSDLTSESYRYYVAAIQDTNAALASSETVAQDTTLLAVIALSYFESISGSDARSMSAWSQHIKGTTALIQIRGAAQLQTAQGRLLFMQATTCLISDSMRCGIRLPPCVPDMVNEMDAYRQNIHDPMLLIHKLMMRLTDLKTDTIYGDLEDVTATIEQLLRLDSQFSSAFDHAPDAWNYVVQACRTNVDSPMPAYIHLYQNSLTAQCWNSMRNGRIICHALILTLLRRQTVRLDSAAIIRQRNQSRIIMCQSQMEILATVPQHLGYASINPFESYDVNAGDLIRTNGPLPGPSMAMFRVVGLDRPSLPVLRTSRGYLLLWALGLAGRVAEAGSALRIAVCNMLDDAGRILGMSQAFIFSNALRENKVAWSVVDDPTWGSLAGPNMNNEVLPIES